MVAGHKSILGSVCETYESKGPRSTHIFTDFHVSLSRENIYSLLQECLKADDPAANRQVQHCIVSNGLDSVNVFNDHLIRLYASCGCLQDANAVFQRVSNPSEYTWTAIISAYVDSREYSRALELFKRRQIGGLILNKCLLLCILKVCCDVSFANLAESVHDQIVKAGLESDEAIRSLLVSMYVKHGCLNEARTLFDRFNDRGTILWSAMIPGYFDSGQCDVALNLLEQMLREGTNPDSTMFLCMLKSCRSTGALEEGQFLHIMIVVCGLESEVALGSSLVDMYAKCKRLKEAQSTFDGMSHRNSISWNSLMAGYAQLGTPAIELFERMQEEGVQIDKVTFLSVLKACRSAGAAELCTRLHNQVTQCGLESDIDIASILVGMYATCGSLQEADELFYKMRNKDVVAWGAIISGYVDAGQGFVALKIFKRMQEQGIVPIKVTFLYALKACSSLRDIHNGRVINDQVTKCGLDLDDVVGSSLIDMYAKCEKLDDANKVFDDLSCKDVIAWGTLIAAYAQHMHDSFSALELFQRMQQQGVRADKLIFLCIIKTCGTLCMLVQGHIMHNLFIKSKFCGDMDVNNALVDMYSKWGFPNDACKCFEISTNQDVLSWGVLIVACVENGFTQLAFRSFEKMITLGLTPANTTIACLLKACDSIGAIQEGRLIHEHVIGGGGNLDTMVANSLIGMYFGCGSYKEAQNVFDRLENPDGVSWGLMIMGCAQNGHGHSALEYFKKMHEQGAVPDASTLTCTLKACSLEGLSREGRLLHNLIIRNEMEKDVAVGNALIDMYSNSGRFIDANKLFDNLASKDEVSWGAILTCNSRYGDGSNVLQLFARMQSEGIKPDIVTATCVMKACSSIGAVKFGRLIHDQVVRCGIEMDLVVGTTLVDMYAKLRSPEEAQRAFNKMQHVNEASWTALLSPSLWDMDIKHVRRWINDSEVQGFRPDSQAYTSILSAYSHVGQPEEAGKHVKAMRESHGITPTIDHFNSIIDSLSRVGQLHEAEEVLLTMPTVSDNLGWVSLLTACRTFGNLEVGSECLDHVAKLDLSGTGGYVMMANMYADAHKWGEVHDVLDFRKCVGAWKRPGQAWLELAQEVHAFTIGDDHFRSESEVCSFKTIRKTMRHHGFVPQLDLVLEANPKDEISVNIPFAVFSSPMSYSLLPCGRYVQGPYST